MPSASLTFSPLPSRRRRRVAETWRLVLTSDRALGSVTIKALDHHRVAVRTMWAIVSKGDTLVPIREKRIAGVFVEIGKFRDSAVVDAYGQIRGQWSKPPPDYGAVRHDKFEGRDGGRLATLCAVGRGSERWRG